MICCTDNTAEVRVPIKHILLSSALLKNNLLQKQKSTFCLSKVTCVSNKTTTLMRSWRNMCKTTIFLMVDNVSPQQSLWWEIVFFVQKICYNLTVSVTLYYTLANFDPYIMTLWMLRNNFWDIICRLVSRALFYNPDIRKDNNNKQKINILYLC